MSILLTELQALHAWVLPTIFTLTCIAGYLGCGWMLSHAECKTLRQVVAEWRPRPKHRQDVFLRQTMRHFYNRLVAAAAWNKMYSLKAKWSENEKGDAMMVVVERVFPTDTGISYGTDQVVVAIIEAHPWNQKHPIRICLAREGTPWYDRPLPLSRDPNELEKMIASVCDFAEQYDPKRIEWSAPPALQNA